MLAQRNWSQLNDGASLKNQDLVVENGHSCCKSFHTGSHYKHLEPKAFKDPLYVKLHVDRGLISVK